MVETYRELAARVLGRPPRLGHTRLVAVDGPSGAGKTVFAARLAAALPGAPLVHTDDLLDGWADQFTFWSRLEEWVLAPLAAGRPGRYRRYDWSRAEFGPEWTEVPPAPVLILEGSSAARRALRARLSFAVFVDAPAEVRLARSLARDGAAMQTHLTVWRRREERHFQVETTAAHVDLVVDGAPRLPHDPEREYVRIGGAARSGLRSPA